MCVGGGAAALGLMRVVLGPSVAEGLQYRAESLRYRAGGGGGVGCGGPLVLGRAGGGGDATGTGAVRLPPLAPHRLRNAQHSLHRCPVPSPHPFPGLFQMLATSSISASPRYRNGPSVPSGPSWMPLIRCGYPLSEPGA